MTSMLPSKPSPCRPSLSHSQSTWLHPSKLHVSSTVALQASNASSAPSQQRGASRQLRRADRDALRKQQTNNKRSQPTWKQWPISNTDRSQAPDEIAVLDAIASCRSELELYNMYELLQQLGEQQQQQGQQGPQLSAQQALQSQQALPPFQYNTSHAQSRGSPLLSAVPQALDPPPYVHRHQSPQLAEAQFAAKDNPISSGHAHSPQHSTSQAVHLDHHVREPLSILPRPQAACIPPRLAVHLLARLSQISPSSAVLATPHLDTMVVYDPLPQALGKEGTAGSEQVPAGCVQPPQLPQSQQRPQQQDLRMQGAQSGAAGSRAAELEEEERAEDEASLRDLHNRMRRQQLIDSLLTSTLPALPQLPLSSITGLLSALARLGYRGWDSKGTLVAQIADHLQRSNSLLLMHRRDPRALANTAWALAKLGHDPGLHWISQFLLATSVSLPKLTAVDLSAIAWALARWHFRPAPQWLGAFYTRLRQVAPQLKTQGICNVSWALAVLRIGPPREVAELLMIETQVQLSFFNAISLATLCWSLAAIGHKPPSFWLHEVFDRLTRTLHEAPQAARGLPHTNMVWALSVWQISPPPGWLTLLCTSATPHLPNMSATSLAVLLTGFADLGHRPQQAWISLALEEFHKRHTDAKPASLVAIVWAVSRLMQPAGTESSPPAGWAPPRKWRVRYAHVLQDIAWGQSRVFGALKPAQLVDAAVAFADLSFYPGDEWMDRHEAYCNMQVEAFTAYQVRLLSRSMEKLDSIFEGDYLPRDGEVV